MELKILHFSDLHLGMQFSNYGEAAEALKEARYETLDRLIKIANDENCDLIVIAGDLFDRVSMKKADVIKAMSSINKFENGHVLILPGNHDFFRNDSNLWRYVMDAKEEHVTVLAEKTPYQLEDYDVSATIYPAPCFSKHSSENEIGWINESEVGGNTINIGVAHGSLKGVAPDLNDEHFPMTREELDIPDINVWLLGHIHIPWPEKPSPSDKIMYSGIPEPEDMNCTHKGTALIIEFDKGGRKSVEVISTGGNYFDRKHLELHSSQDIQQFEEKIRTGNYQNCVCKLSISGSLDPEDYTRWHNEILPRLKEAFLYLKTDETNLRQKITKESLYEMYPEGSFPQELLSGFLENEDQKALETAFDLFKDIKDEN